MYCSWYIRECEESAAVNSNATKLGRCQGRAGTAVNKWIPPININKSFTTIESLYLYEYRALPCRAYIHNINI